MTDKFSFEKAYERLENILSTLNDGEVALDKSLTLYEEANKLIKMCNAQLLDAEKRIEILTKKQDGTLETDGEGQPVSEEFMREKEDLFAREVK